MLSCCAISVCNQLDAAWVADHGVVKHADHGATSLHFMVCYAVFVRGRFAVEKKEELNYIS